MNVRDAETIRSHDAHASLASDGKHAGLPGNAFGPALTKTSAQYHRIGNAFARTVFDYRNDAARGYADDDDVNVVLDRRNVWITFQSFERRILRIDRIDTPLVAISQQRMHGLRARPHTVFRHADHSDRARLQETLELLHLGYSFPLCEANR